MYRAAKKGLWGLKNFEHPADYKRRVKMAEEGMMGADETARRVKQSSSGGFWRGLIGMFRGRG